MRVIRAVSIALVTALAVGFGVFVGAGLQPRQDPIESWDPTVVRPAWAADPDVVPGSTLRPRADPSAGPPPSAGPAPRGGGAVEVPAQRPVLAGDDDTDSDLDDDTDSERDDDDDDDDPDSEPDEIDGLDDSDED